MKNEIVPETVQIQIRKDSSAVITKAEAIVVASSAQENKAHELLVLIKTKTAAIEKQRKAITAPLNKSLKETNTLFKKLSEPLKEADRIIRAKILTFHEEQEAKAEKEQERREKIQAAHEEKGHETHELEEVEPDVGITTTVKRWTFEVVNPHLVPRIYMAIVRAAVNQAIRDGIREIPGLRIYQEEGVRV